MKANRTLAMAMVVAALVGGSSPVFADEVIEKTKSSTTQKAMDWLVTFRKSESEKKAILAERENRRAAKALKKMAEQERKRSGESAEEIKKKFKERNQGW